MDTRRKRDRKSKPQALARKWHTRDTPKLGEVIPRAVAIWLAVLVAAVGMERLVLLDAQEMGAAQAPHAGIYQAPPPSDRGVTNLPG